jgi:hypothetical protein
MLQFFTEGTATAIGLHHCTLLADTSSDTLPMVLLCKYLDKLAE